MWIRSLQRPVDEGCRLPLGIQVSGVSRVVRDGFMVLLVPVIRAMSALDPVRVLVRQHPAQERRKSSKLRVPFSGSTGRYSRDGPHSDHSRGRREDSDSDSDEEGDAEAADPFVALESSVFDIRIRRVVGGPLAAEPGPAPTEEYLPDGHFAEELGAHQAHLTAAAAAAPAHGYRTDSRDYSALSEINSVFDGGCCALELLVVLFTVVWYVAPSCADFDKTAAKEVAAGRPAAPRREEPYNENKPAIAAQLSSLNNYLTSWFAGAVGVVAAAAPLEASASTAASIAGPAHVDVAPRSAAPAAATSSQSNREAAASIINSSREMRERTASSEGLLLGGEGAAGRRDGPDNAVSGLGISSREATPPLPPSGRQKLSNVAARLEAMRKKQ